MITERKRTMDSYAEVHQLKSLKKRAGSRRGVVEEGERKRLTVEEQSAHPECLISPCNKQRKNRQLTSRVY